MTVHMTNAQVALQAAATYFTTRHGAMTDRNGRLTGAMGGYPTRFVTDAAYEFLRWLDARDAEADPRTLHEQAQHIADTIQPRREP